jgi:hypothetical protein
MSPRRSADAGDGGGGGKVGVTALLLVVAAIGMVLLIRARPEPEPFDPRSGADSGTRGLVLLLEDQGASVDVVRSVPAVGSGERVLVLQDRLNDQQRADLLAYVESGGVVVMADEESTITSGDEATSIRRGSSISGSVPSYSTEVLDQLNVQRGECDVASLAHLRGVFVEDGVRFTGTPTQRCFGTGSSSFLVTQRRGDGVIVQLGDNALFTNGRLRYADNGPLATALLAPNDGAQVSILLGAKAAKTTADIGTGEQGLTDLVRPGVWMALLQLAIAFVVFAIARAIRPGRPVREPAQVPIAGSELVVATGNLMQRARHAERAGWLLQGNLYRALCRRFHVPPTISIEQLDVAVAQRTSLPPGHVAGVLGRTVHDNQGLLELSSSLQRIREVALVGASDARPAADTTTAPIGADDLPEGDRSER